MAKTKKTKAVRKAPIKKKAPSELEEQQQQMIWVVGTLIGLMVLFVVFYLFFQSLSTFKYQGLTFTKEKYDKLLVYHYYYYLEDQYGETYRYNLYLRNDPRLLDFPVSGQPALNKQGTVYVSMNETDFSTCSQSNIAIYSLTQFLKNNFFDVEAASPTNVTATQLNRTYATCSTHPLNSVIEIKQGDETSIVSNNFCTTITVDNCEILQAVEKFEVRALIAAKNSSA